MCKFLYPFNGTYPITQEFGNVDVPDSSVYTTHKGTDFATPSNTPLFGRGPYKINYAGIDPEGAQYKGGYGLMLRIQLDAAHEMYLGHLAAVYVKAGDVVSYGLLLGLTDNTGFSTGPHLHIGIKRNGQWIDPMDVLLFTNGNDDTPAPDPVPVDDTPITEADLPCEVEVVGSLGSNMRPDTIIDDSFIVTIPYGKRIPVDKLVNGWLHVEHQ